MRMKMDVVLGEMRQADDATPMTSAQRENFVIPAGMFVFDTDTGVTVMKMDEGMDNGATQAENSDAKGKIISAVKNILKRLLFTLLMIILIPALLMFEMLGDNIAGIICGALKKLQPEGLNSILADVDSFFHTSSLLVILLALLVILVSYVLLPKKRRTYKSQLAGTILTGVCWFVFTKLFSLFIPQFFNASLYGSLASLFLMLLWLWVMIIIFFVGGVLNRVLEEGPKNIIKP